MEQPYVDFVKELPRKEKMYIYFNAITPELMKFYHGVKEKMMKNS